jgi:hypothetical protein
VPPRSESFGWSTSSSFRVEVLRQRHERIVFGDRHEGIDEGRRDGTEVRLGLGEDYPRLVLGSLAASGADLTASTIRAEESEVTAVTGRDRPYTVGPILMRPSAAHQP